MKLSTAQEMVLLAPQSDQWRSAQDMGCTVITLYSLDRRGLIEQEFPRRFLDPRTRRWHITDLGLEELRR